MSRARTTTGPAGTSVIVNRPPTAVRAPRVPGPAAAAPSALTDTCTSARPLRLAESVTVPVMVAVPGRVPGVPCAAAAPLHPRNAGDINDINDTADNNERLRNRLDI